MEPVDILYFTGEVETVIRLFVLIESNRFQFRFGQGSEGENLGNKNTLFLSPDMSFDLLRNIHS